MLSEFFHILLPPQSNAIVLPSIRDTLPTVDRSHLNSIRFITKISLQLSPSPRVPSKEIRAGKRMERLHSGLPVNTPLLLGSSRDESHGNHRAHGTPHDLISRLRKSPGNFRHSELPVKCRQ